jgi:hypothetical protein
MTTKKKQQSKDNPLVGLCFHSIKEDGKTIEWQGYVKSHVGGPKDLYLLQLCEWLTGAESSQELIPSEKMAGWRFYNSAEEMNDHYERYSSRKRAEGGAAPKKPYTRPA